MYILSFLNIYQKIKLKPQEYNTPSLFQAGRWMQCPVVWHVTSGSSHMNFIIFSFFHLLIKDRFALTLLTYSNNKIKKEIIPVLL